ncbi:MAG: NAD-dependent succinate-semialdehyde dehydrogenase [Bacteroidota bacterium]
MPIESINPVNGQRLSRYDEASDQEVVTILEKATKEWQTWSHTSFKERSKLMHAVAQELKASKDDYAEIITEEMGKSIVGAKAEVEKCAWVCDYYATVAESFLKAEVVKTEAPKSYIAFEPLGLILGIMPWNYPFWQVFRFAAPALMAGNGAILKHASNVPACALTIEKIFQKVGFPDNIFRTLLISSKKVDKVIEHHAIQAVTLTGSTPAGRAVAAKAGSMLKKVVLELGGSDPYIVLADADLSQAVGACLSGRMKNAGQSCTAAKRIIVEAPIAEAFTKHYLAKLESFQLADPMDEQEGVSPLARVDLRDQLHEQVQKSIKLGAKCLLGGKVPTQPPFDKGAYYPPTLLTKVKKGMPAYDEELFGPVSVIIVAEDEQKAIAIANDTPFGLAGAVFSKDIQKAERIAREQVQVGGCFVNHETFSDPRLPFGGIKASGYGRELSYFGIREFVNVKSVAVYE